MLFAPYTFSATLQLPSTHRKCIFHHQREGAEQSVHPLSTGIIGYCSVKCSYSHEETALCSWVIPARWLHSQQLLPLTMYLWETGHPVTALGTGQNPLQWEAPLVPSKILQALLSRQENRMQNCAHSRKKNLTLGYRQEKKHKGGKTSHFVLKMPALSYI